MTFLKTKQQVQKEYIKLHPEVYTFQVQLTLTNWRVLTVSVHCCSASKTLGYMKE